ncbi:hypothetical protein N7448_008855 [Penicillium atrosanguineum]|uniref:Uncharacterized protein n=1 Tax=Penicillium atrosanguineum TaxID=1132637 RepID=A0A9W9UDL3_9EURO|nr:hypothetical protein N7448_008855 [Penicillium atrosanguineum]KAJ5330335.1 hypothetical protein N7476_000118 [Penicillium atrosanguineum]
MSFNKRILITGCSANGIGAAIALALARKGHHIFATARKLSKIPVSLSSISNVTLVQLDVTSPKSITEAVRVVEDYGVGLDILINNAGIGYTMPLLDVDIETAQRTYDTNVWGVLRVTQAFAPLLLRNKGKIVTLSSVGGVTNTPWIVERGANINGQDGFYKNTLQAASSRGHDKIVQILLERGAYVNAQGEFYGNALRAASSGGHEKIAQMLLEQGANVNAQGGFFENALQAASSGGHDKIDQKITKLAEYTV